MRAPISTPETPIDFARSAPAAGATSMENVCREAAADDTLPIMFFGVSDWTASKSLLHSFKGKLNKMGS
ncbi:hypothetical protein [Mesobacillus jeotgali]|uniref:hypothetical protein n=1 Tax=Mesobacillus jeotgali TaxID=129985 RepID=UPI001CFCCE56|nr:hypothetical protein [Mesobacillus jeotgali]